MVIGQQSVSTTEQHRTIMTYRDLVPGEAHMQRCKVLVLNDFTAKGGAEEVYRTSVECLQAMPYVEVEHFDFSRFADGEPPGPHAWNVAAARALRQVLERFRPERVLVHNYHNCLSPSVLATIARYKRLHGFT